MYASRTSASISRDDELYFSIILLYFAVNSFIPSSSEIVAAIEKSSVRSIFIGFPVLTPGDTPVP